jgi:hypothetical protein
MRKPNYKDFQSVGDFKDALEAAHPPRYLSIFICFEIEKLQRRTGWTFPQAYGAAIKAGAVIPIPKGRAKTTKRAT